MFPFQYFITQEMRAWYTGGYIAYYARYVQPRKILRRSLHLNYFCLVFYHLSSQSHATLSSISFQEQETR
jgi:hypothetical protein